MALRVMVIAAFNKTIDAWIESVQKYSYDELLVQPNKNYWSLGQVCMHLLNDTNWFIKQINICVSNNDNADETMSSFAITMFANNSFPNQKLINPANANMPQPQSKEVLLQSFIKLKKNMNDAATAIVNRKSKGKTQHPGFGYFNATEWLHFAEMHLRHHLKQKKIIEKYVNKIV